MLVKMNKVSVDGTSYHACASAALLLNPRTGGGGLISTPPVQFSADNEKNGGA